MKYNPLMDQSLRTYLLKDRISGNESCVFPESKSVLSNGEA